nr:proteinaceous RNase P 2 [Ipomoea batatas]
MTAEIIERWFGGEEACEVGLLDWDARQVKEMILRNGGGWHGLGWLGKGNWVVQRSNIASDGLCHTCSEQLVCVDIDKAETEMFAQSVASLAMERESQSRSCFSSFS